MEDQGRVHPPEERPDDRPLPGGAPPPWESLERQAQKEERREEEDGEGDRREGQREEGGAPRSRQERPVRRKRTYLSSPEAHPPHMTCPPNRSWR